MQFDIDSYIPSDSVLTRKSSTYWGKEHGKFWKKYICDSIRLYYYNVNKEDKKKYDDIVKSVRIDKRLKSKINSVELILKRIDFCDLRICPVVLLVLLRIGLLPVHLCHSHDGGQRNELVVVI